MRVVVILCIGVVLSLTSMAFARGTVDAYVFSEPDRGFQTLQAKAGDLYKAGEGRAGTSSARQDELNHLLSSDTHIQWEVYVPPLRDDGAIPGVLVYISPWPYGHMPREWAEVMDRHNLIWVGANKSGNRINPVKRSLYTILGLSALGGVYVYDPKQVYVSGFSGGGRMASYMITDYPAIFKGAIYFCGVNFWDTQDEDKIAHFKSHAYAFVTGRRDFNQRDTRRIYKKYERENVEHIRLFDLKYLGHELPRPEDFDAALRFVTSPHTD